jgi:GNAT superfamily N-acetyltransferase
LSGWTCEDKEREAMRAPIGSHIPQDGTRVVERPGWYQVLTPGTRHGTSNEIVESKVPDEEIEATIDRVVAEYAAHDLTFRWLVDQDTRPRDLGERLERRGFVHWHARAMTADPWALTVDRVPGARVELVDASNAEAYARALSEGWGTDTVEYALARCQRLLALPGRPLFVAWADGVPAGAAGAVEHERSVYFVGGAVVPSMRGHGLYRALVRARLEHAKARGLSLVTTQAREKTSAPILERLGFETVRRFRMYANR